MRLGILIIGLFLFINSTYSQRTWGNYQGNIGGDLYTILHECGDTIINDVQWTAVKAYTWNPWFNKPDKPSPRGYIRTEGKRSYWLLAEKELLLYDMGMKLGDTVELGGRPRYRIFSLIEIDTIEVFGEQRRRQKMRNIRHDYDDYWVEGIGSTKNHYLWPGEADIIFDGGSWSVCYKEGNNSEVWQSESDSLHCFMQDFNTNCEGLLSTLEREEEQTFYPNPWNQETQSLTIGGLEGESRIVMYTIEGKTVYNGSIESLCNEWINPGIYLLEYQKGKKTIIIKLIVQ